MTKIFLLDDVPRNLEILDQKKIKIFPLNYKVENILRIKKLFQLIQASG